LAALRDCSNPQTVVLGRTGAGKSALLSRLLEIEQHAVELLPETLALNYIANSNIIQFFETAGVRLDLFYKLLWNHVLTVELLKLRYPQNGSSRKFEIISALRQLLDKNEGKERALKYLEQWGDKFWERTEDRIREFTTKLESDLRASAKGDFAVADLNAEFASKLSREEKREIVNRANDTVNRVQIRELADLISLLSDDVFNDPQKRYFVVIDRLDEGWAEDKIRYKLIKALLESVRAFRKVRNVKIVIALRTDLHQRVLRETVSAGFQEEKYHALYLHLRWTREQLKRLLSDRVSFMFRRQYSDSRISIEEILPPNQKGQKSALDYILDRTFHRPRDAIMFINECIKQAEGQTRISAQTLRAAEIVYSRQRLDALADEWIDDYPALKACTKVLIKRPPEFTLAELKDEEVEDFAFELLQLHGAERDPTIGRAEQCVLGDIFPIGEFVRYLASVFYQVGLIGAKLNSFTGMEWSYVDHPLLDLRQVDATTKLQIHPTFWAALGVARRA